MTNTSNPSYQRWPTGPSIAAPYVALTASLRVSTVSFFSSRWQIRSPAAHSAALCTEDLGIPLATSASRTRNPGPVRFGFGAEGRRGGGVDDPAGSDDAISIAPGSDTLRLADEKTATARRRASMIDCPFGGRHVSTRPLRSSYERRLETGVPKSKCDGDLRVPARANSWKRADLAIIWHCRKIKPRATAFKNPSRPRRRRTERPRHDGAARRHSVPAGDPATER